MKDYKTFIKIILMLILISGCDKNIYTELIEYDSNSYIESIFGVTFDEDIEELVNDAFLQLPLEEQLEIIPDI